MDFFLHNGTNLSVGPDDGLNSTPHISKSGKTVPYNSFYLKVLFFKKIQKSLNIWARFVGNFFTKNFKNRPIWSHWNLSTHFEKKNEFKNINRWRYKRPASSAVFHTPWSSHCSAFPSGGPCKLQQETLIHRHPASQSASLIRSPLNLWKFWKRNRRRS